MQNTTVSWLITQAGSLPQCPKPQQLQSQTSQSPPIFSSTGSLQFYYFRLFLLKHSSRPCEVTDVLGLLVWLFDERPLPNTWFFRCTRSYRRQAGSLSRALARRNHDVLYVERIFSSSLLLHTGESSFLQVCQRLALRAQLLPGTAVARHNRKVQETVVFPSCTTCLLLFTVASL